MKIEIVRDKYICMVGELYFPVWIGKETPDGKFEIAEIIENPYKKIFYKLIILSKNGNKINQSIHSYNSFPENKLITNGCIRLTKKDLSALVHLISIGDEIIIK